MHVVWEGAGSAHGAPQHHRAAPAADLFAATLSPLSSVAEVPHVACPARLEYGNGHRISVLVNSFNPPFRRPTQSAITFAVLGLTSRAVATLELGDIRAFYPAQQHHTT